MLLTLVMTLIVSALPAAACRNNFVFSKYGVCSGATREIVCAVKWQQIHLCELPGWNGRHPHDKNALSCSEGDQMVSFLRAKKREIQNLS